MLRRIHTSDPESVGLCELQTRCGDMVIHNHIQWGRESALEVIITERNAVVLPCLGIRREKRGMFGCPHADFTTAMDMRRADYHKFVFVGAY